MFCRFCGKEIPEGTICGCEASTNVQLQKTDVQIVESKFDGSAFFINLKDIFIRFIKSPRQFSKQAYMDKEENQIFVFGGIFFLLALIIVIALTKDIGNVGEQLKIALIVELVLVAEKLIFGGLVYLFAKKDGAVFKQIMKVTCLTTIQLSVCLLILLFFGLMGVTTGIIIMVECYIFADVIAGILVTDIVFENKNFGYWIYVLITFIMIVLGYIVLRNVALAVMDNMMSNLSWLF